MTATYMDHVARAELDDGSEALLRIVLRAGITTQDWCVIAIGARDGADVGERVDAVLLVAGPLMDLLEPGDDEVLLRAFLPRLSVADRARVIADIRDELEQVDRFAGMNDAGEVADALDVNASCLSDWVTVAEDRAEAFRQSARSVATTAALR